MTVALPASNRRVVEHTCPGCGEPRTISYETSRRIARGLLSGRCQHCPQDKPKPRPVRDTDRKFWLRRFGVPSSELRGVTAADYVAQHGLPEGLASLVASMVDATHP